MSSPKFSILMPVVKTRYFREAFDSAAAQTFDDYEIVVIDNKADTDVSWVETNLKASLYKNDNQLPPAENWNRGIGQCKGDYTILLSDDDLLRKDCLKQCDEFFAKHPDITVARFLRANIDTDGRETGYSCPGKERESLTEYVYYQMTHGRGQVISDIVFRTEAAIKMGGFKNLAHAWGADHFFAIELASKANAIGNINEILMSYRMHSQNISNAKSVIADFEKMQADLQWLEWTSWLLREEPGAFYMNTLKVIEQKRQRQCDDALGAAKIHGGVFGMLKLLYLSRGMRYNKMRSLVKGLLRRA